jgi:hypothetical protein
MLLLGTDTAETQAMPLPTHVEQPVPEKPLEDHQTCIFRYFLYIRSMLFNFSADSFVVDMLFNSNMSQFIMHAHTYTCT